MRLEFTEKNLRGPQMSRRVNPTHIGIVTSQWFTVTRIIRTFTIGTAIDARR